MWWKRKKKEGIERRREDWIKEGEKFVEEGGGWLVDRGRGDQNKRAGGRIILFPHPEERGWWYWYLCHMIASINFAVLRPTDKLLLLNWIAATDIYILYHTTVFRVVVRNIYCSGYIFPYCNCMCTYGYML